MSVKCMREEKKPVIITVYDCLFNDQLKTTTTRIDKLALVKLFLFEKFLRNLYACLELMSQQKILRI